MTLAEIWHEQFQDTGSVSCFAFEKRALLANKILEVRASQSIDWNYPSFTFDEYSNTQTPPHSDTCDEMDVRLFTTLTSVYGDLLSSQEELDEVAKNALYSNLWDLYE